MIVKQNIVTFWGEGMDYISKKELLAQTGISYGQLYRWKREKLIPEDWFVKQASFTGQETFFPKEQITARVEAILAAKDSYSLEELARMFSPETADMYIRADALGAIGDIEGNVRRAVEEAYPKDSYTVAEAALFVAVSSIARAANLTESEAAQCVRAACSAARGVQGVQWQCVLFSCADGVHAALTKPAMPVRFDEGVRVIGMCAVHEAANQIKIKYAALLQAHA